VKQAYKIIDIKIMSWLLTTVLIGLIAGMMTANYEEKIYRARRSTRGGRRKEQTVYILVKKASG
jgi:hypothetical protein